jgi:hypothetical protein
MTKAAELAKMGEVLTNSQIGGRRNILINGSQIVAQRATQVTGIGASGGYQTVDRWTISAANTAGRFTMDQSTDTPSGFANSTKLTCTTADTSIAAGEILQFQTKIEGQDLQSLKKGTSDAEKVTVSFYVKGNANATYTCELHDRDNTRYNGQEFSVTTSWTRIILTFTGDTTGAFDNDNAVSMSLNFNLHGGSTYTGGTFSSNTWHTTANQRFGDNQTSFFDSTDRTFFITGLQMEVGSQATPFEHRSFGEELELCKRYYQSVGDRSNNHTLPLFDTAAQDATDSTSTFHFFPPMRATPTLETTGTAADYKIYTNNTNIALASVPSFGSGSTQCGFLSAAVSSGLTAGEVCHVTGNTDPAFVAFTAEL